MSSKIVSTSLIETYLLDSIHKKDSIISHHAKNIKVEKLRKIGGSVNSVYYFTLFYFLKGKKMKIDLVLKVFESSELQRKMCQREFSILDYLSEANFPVPPVYILENCERFLGGPFIIMKKIEGKSIEKYLKHNKKKTNTIIVQLAETLASLHELVPDTQKLVLLDFPEDEYSYSKKSSLLKDRLDYAKNWDYTWITNWLQINANKCSCDTYSLLHFDMNLKNFIVTDRDKLFMIDWEWPEIGDPIRDVGCAFHEIKHSLGEKPAVLFLKSYRKFSKRFFTDFKLNFYLVVSGLNLALYFRFISVKEGTPFLIKLFGKNFFPLFPIIRWHFRRRKQKLENFLRNVIDAN